ncbi:selenocysteine-specific translation elongation factor [Phenylobacterium sp.]|uniref:selenocysteine-specific translation elongation factor n=1 Tax=Phenylobacterium sp. TaxID=1871053 RepID=UPI001216A622|nr:selenocysteine-specific translation elongation factor [Phenylobacterium sp.]THD58119.1 MAG: selenocysteine-specific translation elongation factor [Phenylobacterium sp.]
MIVGTAGHIDHGKTSLVRALTGVDTDRLKEEKARGITIELGFAYLPAPGGETIGFVDVPGHERFVRTMVAGSSGIDFALLAVAADDGCKPQTFEHLAILDMLGVRRGLVALTKADAVPPGRVAEVMGDMAGILADGPLADAPVLPVSAVTGEGLEPLREWLFRAAGDPIQRPVESRFRLAVDRVFTLAGAGVIVTGTALSGEVRVGDRVLLSPQGLPARVRALHVQNRPAPIGRAGQRCALNLSGEGVTTDAIHRGDMALDPELHAPADRIDASLRLLPGEGAALRPWFPVRLHHAAAEVAARIVRLDDEPLSAGGSAMVQLVLERPIAVASSDRFVIRDVSGQRTLGGGRFLDLRAPARKRRTPERIGQLQALTLSSPAEVLGALLDAAPHHCDWRAFRRDHALSEAQAHALAQELALVVLEAGDDAVALLPARWAALTADIMAALAALHAEHPDVQGLGRERLRLMLQPRLPAPAFAAALQSLARGQGIALDGAFVRLATHTVRLTEADEALWDEIAPRLGAAERFRPPRVRDLAEALGRPEGDIRRLCKLCARLGRVDEVAHDHFFLRGTVQEMADIVARLSAQSADGVFTAAAFRDQVDNGRKVAIQILDFFDRHGVTLRRGDQRRVNKHRLDLFGTAV